MKTKVSYQQTNQIRKRTEETTEKKNHKRTELKHLLCQETKKKFVVTKSHTINL